MIRHNIAVRRPQDLPALRDWLIDIRPDGYWHPDFFKSVLPRADLWWVDAPACALLADATDSYPTTVELSESLIPSLFGLAFLAEPIVGTDTVTGETIEVAALIWAPYIVQRPNGTEAMAIAVVILARAPADLLEAALIGSNITDYVPANGLPLVHIGGNTWELGTPIASISDDPRASFFPGTPAAAMMASNIEDRRLLACLWHLSRTPITQFSPARFTRPELRRAARIGQRTDVRVLSLRPHDTTDEHDTGSRNYRHQWIVRPHWRWQPFGPGRAQRRLILVGPYIKGPEGAPLLGGERVWRLKGDR